MKHFEKTKQTKKQKKRCCLNWGSKSGPPRIDAHFGKPNRDAKSLELAKILNKKKACLDTGSNPGPRIDSHHWARGSQSLTLTKLN